MIEQPWKHGWPITYTPTPTAEGRNRYTDLSKAPPGIAASHILGGSSTNGVLDALWVIEGIGNYGAAPARLVASAGYLVVQATRMLNKTRHGIGKKDTIDAHQIAAAVLPLATDHLRHAAQRRRRHPPGGML